MGFAKIGMPKSGRSSYYVHVPKRYVDNNNLKKMGVIFLDLDNPVEADLFHNTILQMRWG